MPTTNRRMILTSRPRDEVTDDCFTLVTETVPSAGPTDVLVRHLWSSFEPAQRGWLNDIPSYMPPVAIGEVMRAFGVGQVAASNSAAFPVGSFVHGSLGWQEWCVVDVSQPDHQLESIPSEIDDPLLMLSALGVTGLTAWFGMTRVARPLLGDTVLVTAAAGATGSVAAQLARLAGAHRVIGTAGSAAKRAWAVEVAGLDECVDHHDDKIRRRLREVAPEGFDVVFDNVGGRLLDAALFNLAEGARVALCGSISTGYRPELPEVGLHHYQLLTTRRARMEGFLLFDHRDSFTLARQRLARYVRSGRLVVQHDMLEGLERAPEGLRRLFRGLNTGKQILHIADPLHDAAVG